MRIQEPNTTTYLIVTPKFLLNTKDRGIKSYEKDTFCVEPLMQRPFDERNPAIEFHCAYRTDRPLTAQMILNNLSKNSIGAITGGGRVHFAVHADGILYAYYDVSDHKWVLEDWEDFDPYFHDVSEKQAQNIAKQMRNFYNEFMKDYRNGQNQNMYYLKQKYLEDVID